jgi:hypothetical protein
LLAEGLQTIPSAPEGVPVRAANPAGTTPESTHLREERDALRQGIEKALEQLAANEEE